MKNSGLFLSMAKWLFFLGLFFEVLILKGLFLVCLVLFSKVLKMLVFSQFFGFFCGGSLLFIWVWKGLGVFVFLVFAFLLCLALVSVLFALFLVLWLDVVVFFVVCFFLLFFCFVCFCLSLFVFFGGFKGQCEVARRATSLGPKPSLFYLFLFFFVFCFFFLFFPCPSFC